MEQQAANSVWLWLSDEENWERFSAADAAKIEHTLSIGDKGLVLERNYTTYFLDLLRFTQTSARTGTRRRIRRVQRCSLWFARDSPSEPWESFSRAEERDLEEAFFEGSESFILQRTGGDEVHYVDFMKWTVIDLSDNFTRQMKAVGEGEDVNADQGEEETSARASITSSGTSTIASVAASAKIEKEAVKNHQEPARLKIDSESAKISDAAIPQQAKRLPQDEIVDDGDITVTTLPEDYDSSHHSNEILPIGSNETPTFSGSSKPIRRSISQRSRPSWRWEDDGASWAPFDEETSAAIERSWEFGAPEMVFERSSTAYFVDLVNLTQTNTHTGNTRPIQRVEES